MSCRSHPGRVLSIVPETRSEIKIPEPDVIPYTGIVTEVLERETLAAVDEETRRALEVAADNYENGPARLQAAILAAARKGERPAAITRAIGYAYTYDFVAKLIRGDRRANPGLYPAGARDS